MKKIFRALLVICVCFASSGACAAPGDSTYDPIFITTAAQLDDVRNDLNKFYKLSNEIDLTEYLASGDAAGWMPIGNSGAPFTGEFDGAGYRIIGLWINRSGMDYVGLFGVISGATIKNLGVESAGIKGDGHVGGIAGLLIGGSVTNCYAKGNVTGVNNIGGLVGSQNAGSGGSGIVNCYATGNIIGGSYAGGLAGAQVAADNNCRIEGCYATGNVTTNGSNSGGLVGSQYASGDVSCSIQNCYATGNVICFNGAGGLVGSQYSNGDGKSSVTNCYATGNVTTTGNNAGGLVGTQYVSYGANSRNVIINSYATGNITAIGSIAGGLAGYQFEDGADNNANTIVSSYRYINLTINGIVIAADNPESAPDGKHGGVKTTDDLMTKTTYTLNSWLFNDSSPATGLWYWDSRGFPKLNIGAENFSFPFAPTPLIAIISHPQSTALPIGKAPGSLSVTASVTPSGIVYYQWYSNTEAVNTGGALIYRATNSTFTIPENLAVGKHYYYCVISSTGAEPVPSDVATVTVEEKNGCNAMNHVYFTVILLGLIPFTRNRV